MNDFLINKFNDFNSNAIIDFGNSITDFMPFTPVSGYVTNPSTTIWGRENGCVWAGNGYEMRLFENNGTVHIVTANANAAEYYQAHTEIFQATRLLTTTTRISAPLEISDVTITATDHLNPAVTAGSTVHYMKFETPLQGFGFSARFEYLFNPDTNESEFFTKFIDELSWILSKLNSNGHKFPIWYNLLSQRQKDADGYFYLPLTSLDYTAEQCFTEYVAGLEDSLNAASIPGTNEIILYAREQWAQVLKI